MIKGKSIDVIKPPFPGYLFVNVEGYEQLIGSISSTRGVRRLLKFGITPLEIQNTLICDLRNRCYKQIENQSDESTEGVFGT